MNINMERIQEIFGNSMITNIKENQEDFVQNIEYILSLGYKNVNELVELYPHTFLMDSKEFQEKVDNLLASLGVESFEKIEENTEIWGSLDE